MQSHDVRGWCQQYCDEHWHGEYLDYNNVSVYELFDMLRISSYHNPINIGLLKFLANKSGHVGLINSVKNYEKKFSCMIIEDLDFIREITVDGNISRGDSTLIVNTLLENKVTIGQLWSFCTPRMTNIDILYGTRTLILNASEPLLEFYYSFKVCICNVW